MPAMTIPSSAVGLSAPPGGAVRLALENGPLGELSAAKWNSS